MLIEKILASILGMVIGWIIGGVILALTEAIKSKIRRHRTRSVIANTDDADQNFKMVKSTEPVILPKNFQINFYADQAVFLFRGAPLYQDACRYGQILDGIYDYTVKSHNRRLREAVTSLKDQEKSLLQLRDRITKIVHELNATDVNLLESIINQIFQAYRSNRSDAVDAIKSIFDRDSAETEEERYAVIEDIIHDNTQFITGLDEFCTVMRETEATANKDKTSAHITDFSGLDQLHELVKQLKRNVDEDSFAYHAAPTLEVPKKRSATTLLGIDPYLLKHDYHYNPDALIVDTEEINETAPMYQDK